MFIDKIFKKSNTQRRDILMKISITFIIVKYLLSLCLNLNMNNPVNDFTK